MILLGIVAGGLALAVPLPAMHATKQRSGVMIVAQAPAGYHFADELDATVKLSNTGYSWRGASELLEQGVRFPVKRKPVAGVAEVGVCADDGGACVPLRVAFAPRAGNDKRRVVPLAVQHATRDAAEETSPHPQDLPSALAAAVSSGKNVLLDFTAVWCPPCNQLAAEVLDDPTDAELLDDVVVLKVDVDRFDSWGLKDRFEVGSYPTLVMVDPSGEEIDRLVGYPGEAAFVSWLTKSTSRPAASTLPETDALLADPALAVAIRLASTGREQRAATYLTRAESLGDGSPEQLHVARLLINGDGASASWLLDNGAPEPSWVWAAWEQAQLDPILSAKFVEKAQAAIPSVDPVFAADLLFAVGRLATEQADVDTSRLMFAAAAATLEASLTGEASHDRGHWTFLADLKAEAGDADGARRLLQQAEQAFPDEMTFSYALAGLLIEQEQFAAAVAAANRAVAVSYGDNALRSARRLAEALHASGEPLAAREVIAKALRSAPDVGDVRVRTPRYLDELERLDASIASMEVAPE